MRPVWYNKNRVAGALINQCQAKAVFLLPFMQILEAKSHLTAFSVKGTPAGLFHLKTQYGYDLNALDAGHYLFSCVSSSDVLFYNDSEIKFACDVAFLLNNSEKPTVEELLELAQGARDEMNRLFDEQLEQNNLGVMQIAALNIAETEAILTQMLA